MFLLPSISKNGVRTFHVFIGFLFLNEIITLITFRQIHQEVEAPKISGQSGQVKVAKLSALCPGRLYPQEIPLVLISVIVSVDPSSILRPEVLSQRKILTAPSGIEPATYRLVTQCINQMRNCLPPPHRVIR
jgi:hypothetical protein